MSIKWEVIHKTVLHHTATESNGVPIHSTTWMNRGKGYTKRKKTDPEGIYHEILCVWNVPNRHVHRQRRATRSRVRGGYCEDGLLTRLGLHTVHYEIVFWRKIGTECVRLRLLKAVLNFCKALRHIRTQSLRSCTVMITLISILEKFTRELWCAKHYTKYGKVKMTVWIR